MLYHRYHNIGDLFLKEPQCDSYCPRPCCAPEIQDLLSGRLDNQSYTQIINRALDLSSFEPHIYLKAIVAEIKLEQDDLISQFLDNPTLDHLLNRQKFDYFRTQKPDLTEDQEIVFQMLREQIVRDQATLRYKRLFGNELQGIILGLLPQAKLKQLLNKPHPLSMILQILSYLTGSNLRSFVDHERDEFRQIALAKSDLSTRIRILREPEREGDKLAAVHDLSREEYEALLSQLDPNQLPISVQLKIIGNYEDYTYRAGQIESPIPHIQAAAVYQLIQHKQMTPEAIQPMVRSLLLSHDILVQLPNSDQFFYQILLDYPDIPMAPYVVNLIRDRNLLDKLMFHPSLRSQIRLRLSFIS